eukprot:1188622-Prorocentrum_minimum.AAC.11
MSLAVAATDPLSTHFRPPSDPLPTPVMPPEAEVSLEEAARAAEGGRPGNARVDPSDKLREARREEVQMTKRTLT